MLSLDVDLIGMNPSIIFLACIPLIDAQLSQEATASTRRPVQQVLVVLLTGTVTVATMVTATVATIMVTVTKANSGEKLRFSSVSS